MVTIGYNKFNKIDANDFCVRSLLILANYTASINNGHMCIWLELGFYD